MSRALAIVVAAILTGCGGGGTASQALPSTTSSNRIVSIDYCADQMVLGLVHRSRIAGVSHEVAADPLFSERLSSGVPRVRPEAEMIIAMRPTLVVRSYAGGPRLEATLRRAGIRVFTLPYASQLADIREAMVTSGQALAAEGAATSRLAEFDRQIARVHASRATALYTTPGSYTAGSATLINDMIASAGLENAEQRSGWHRLDLERLVERPPHIVIRAFGESLSHQSDRWSAADHHALDSAFADSVRVDIPGSWVACGNWRMGLAIGKIRRAATR